MLVASVLLTGTVRVPFQTPTPRRMPGYTPAFGGVTRHPSGYPESKQPALKTPDRRQDYPAPRPTRTRAQPGKALRVAYPTTPDGRYFVVRGRLWRCSDPSLSPERKAELVSELMRARRAVGVTRRAADREALAKAGAAVDKAKIALGERGPVWWTDGQPDFNRHLAKNTPYREWYESLS